MNKIQEYSIVRGEHTSALIENVKEAIKDGFQPMGGIAVAVSSRGEVLFVQAVVKYDDAT